MFFIKRALFLLTVLSVAGCSSNSNNVARSEMIDENRSPASVDLSGSYLGEGEYRRGSFLGGVQNPAVRLYLKRDKQEDGAYYAVLFEYDALQNMALPYLAAQKAPALNKVIGYLDNIASRISVYRMTPRGDGRNFDLKNLTVRVSRSKSLIVESESPSLYLTLGHPASEEHLLSGAVISGDPMGEIRFPGKNDKKSFWGGLANLATVSQYELASFTYKKAKLASTWRGDFENLEGSYLSQYGRLDDGVLELYSSRQNQQAAKFIKSKTKPGNYTNPKSAGLEGDFLVHEVIPNMFVFNEVRTSGSQTHQEIASRIGLFLDIFDASAPEAGGQMVVELALVNPENPADFLMYYQHPQHLRNIGVRK